MEMNCSLEAPTEVLHTYHVKAATQGLEQSRVRFVHQSRLAFGELLLLLQKDNSVKFGVYSRFSPYSCSTTGKRKKHQIFTIGRRTRHQDSIKAQTTPLHPDNLICQFPKHGILRDAVNYVHGVQLLGSNGGTRVGEGHPQRDAGVRLIQQM